MSGKSTEYLSGDANPKERPKVEVHVHVKVEKFKK